MKRLSAPAQDSICSHQPELKRSRQADDPPTRTEELDLVLEAESFALRMLGCWERGDIAAALDLARKSLALDPSQMAPRVALFCAWSRDPSLLQAEPGRDAAVAKLRESLRDVKPGHVERALLQLRSMPIMPRCPETRQIDRVYSRLIGDTYDAFEMRAGEDDLKQYSRLDAQFALALLLGPTEDATRLIRLAASENHTCAMAQLGLLTLNGGPGVERDPLEAARYLSAAAERGLSSAQFALGVLFEEGVGVVQNFKEAVRLYRKAVIQGNAQAQYRMADLLLKGCTAADLPADRAQALELARLSAEQRSPLAMLLLGALLDADGHSAEAASWYGRAVDMGSTDAHFCLAALLESGRAGQFDIGEVARHYAAATEAGNTAAAERYAKFALSGFGVPQDVRVGTALLQRCALAGSSECLFELSKLHAI